MHLTHPSLAAFLFSFTTFAASADAQVRFQTLPGSPVTALYTQGFANAGDVDGDGYPDLIHQRNTNDLSQPNGVNVVSVIDGRLLYAFDGPPIGQGSYGNVVAGVGDLNADGFDDFAVSALSGDGNLANTGFVDVHSGADGSIMLTVSGQAAGDRFGSSVVATPDQDGDGVADLLIGAWGVAGPAATSGAVSLHSGATGAVLWTVIAPTGVRLFGHSSACLGDTNGDGICDVAVGAPGRFEYGTGRVLILSCADGSQVLDVPVRPSDARFGWAVGSIGDATGDGLADLLVGAPGELSTGSPDPGNAYLISGSDGSVVQRVQGPEVGARVESVGDYDQDGVQDFLTGHPSTNTFDSVSVRLYSGAQGVELTRITAAFGWLLAYSLGDLDGDLRSEILVRNISLGTFEGWLGARAVQSVGCIPSALNSAGQRAVVQYEGSSSVAFGFGGLETSGLPSGSLAMSILSLTPDFVANPAGSQGNLCLGGSIGRLLGPGQVLTAGSTGSVSIELDPAALPQPSGTVAAMVGEVWFFQTWYRDTVGGLATSNFSSSTAVAFR